MKSNRRNFISNTALGIFGISAIPNQLAFGNPISPKDLLTESEIHPLYPSTDPKDVSAVVGAAHTNFEKVKELVDARPELAKATYDWGFGDVESALGAASHMGRKDIAEYLIEMGARPNIFTFAMLGKIDAVKAIIESMPGIERIKGPHGFTLLFHAKMPLRREFLKGEEKAKQEELVKYLEGIEGANIPAKAIEMTDEEKAKYLGKYPFGEGENDFFEVTLNSRNWLFLKRGDYTGRVLNKIDEHIFAPSGAPSVRIHFEMEDGLAKSIAIHDPLPIISVAKI